MYDQLRILEKMILDIKTQYQLVSAELSSLKQKPTTDPKELLALKTQLNSFRNEHDNAKKQLGDLDKLKKQLSDFDSRYQSLAKAHHMIGEEQDKLNKQIELLEQQNHDLKQHNNELKQQYGDIAQQNSDLKKKNELAAERTQVVLQRLTRIDQTEG